MGLNLQGNHVTVDHSHQRWLITIPQGNPTREFIGNLTVYSIFKRQKASQQMRRNRQSRLLGDNCPLIYALKNKEGLTTDFSSIKKLNVSFKSILEIIALNEPDGYDIIISMPSAHNISHIVGRRFSRYFNAIHLTNLLRKITVEEAYQLLEHADIDVSEKKSLRFQLKRQRDNVEYRGKFSLKGIPISLRKIFPPLAVNRIEQLLIEPRRILITDDLLASGTTLETAAKIIRKIYPYAQIQAACLFSSMGKLT